jgi:hypothetical protein
MFDIVFISYGETNADENFKKLKSRFPLAKRVKDVKGIHQAHIAAANKAFTDMLWVVDGDAVIFDHFNFVYDSAYKELDQNTVYIYRSQNPVNDLVYGYGGVKLLPKKLTLDLDTTSSDMTTSISKQIVALPELANITAFNSDPFSAWRSAFRETCKLSSGTIKYRNKEVDEYRLTTWCEKFNNVPYADYVKLGALAGREYGTTNKNDISRLSLINDFEWLKNEFSRNSL